MKCNNCIKKENCEINDDFLMDLNNQCEGDIMNKRWKLNQQNYDEKVEFSLIDTKLNITVQMSLTNWMLIDVFTTVGGFDKVELDESVDEKKLLDYLEWEKSRN